MHKEPIILGIESSCDDTSAAILRDKKILSNIVANQKVHSLYGGVVPELASRAHQQNIIPVVDAAIKKANINKKDISAVAFTKGPGLLGSLLVGTSLAKAFAIGLNIPLIAVNHMQAHILSHFIDEDQEMPNFPFLCLTVSGGHTQIVKVESYNKMTIIGTTLDDAAGEAFDKSAKILGLLYPGGPLIDKYAQNGNNTAFKYGKPKVKGLDFSFSGLEKAIIETGIKEIAIAGGVSANSYFRSTLKKLSNDKKYNLYIPKFEYCTDNAAMIAIAGYFKYLNKKFSNHTETPQASLPF